jgi:trk system potassium uptake protein TrkA
VARKTFGIIGLGRFGSSIARTLHQLGYPTIVIDNNEKLINAIKDHATYAKVLDSTDKEALKESGILNADLIIVSIGRAIRASIMTVLTLKELGAKFVIAKAHSDEQGKILEKLGADKVVYPERDAGIRLANQLTSSDILEFMEISPDYQVNEVDAHKEFIGKMLAQLELRSKHKIIVLAVRRNGESIIIPPATQLIEKGDTLVVLAKNEEMKSFLSRFRLTPKIGPQRSQ